MRLLFVLFFELAPANMAEVRSRMFALTSASTSTGTGAHAHKSRATEKRGRGEVIEPALLLLRVCLVRDGNERLRRRRRQGPSATTNRNTSRKMINDADGTAAAAAAAALLCAAERGGEDFVACWMCRSPSRRRRRRQRAALRTRRNSSRALAFSLLGQIESLSEVLNKSCKVMRMRIIIIISARPRPCACSRNDTNSSPQVGTSWKERRPSAACSLYLVGQASRRAFIWPRRSSRTSSGSRRWRRTRAEEAAIGGSVSLRAQWIPPRWRSAAGKLALP